MRIRCYRIRNRCHIGSKRKRGAFRITLIVRMSAYTFVFGIASVNLSGRVVLSAFVANGGRRIRIRFRICNWNRKRRSHFVRYRCGRSVKGKSNYNSRRRSRSRNVDIRGDFLCIQVEAAMPSPVTVFNACVPT